MDKSVQTLLIQDLFFYNFFSRLLADSFKSVVKSITYKGVVIEWSEKYSKINDLQYYNYNIF